MAILPNSRPSTGWRRGYLTNELHKRDFRCRRTKLRYSRTATIKLWRQHLGAQLPGTLPQPLKTGGTKNNVLVTKPSEQNQDTRVILKKFLVKFEKRRVKTLRQDALPERWGDWEVKRIPKLSDIYFLNDSKHFSRLNSAANNDQAMGLLRSGRLWLPTCNALDAAISPTCRGTT